MSKKSKIMSIILVIIFIIAIVLTGIRGLNVDLNYAEGVSILFDLDQQFNTSDIVLFLYFHLQHLKKNHLYLPFRTFLLALFLRYFYLNY